MTDNEIIKALKCCSKHHNTCVPYCPMDSICDNVRDCLINLSKNTLDLINRQKAEIERYKGVIKILENDIEIAKEEAIKEFAKRLKNEIINDTAYGSEWRQYIGYYDYTIKIGDIPEYIDGIVKEMTEVQE